MKQLLYILGLTLIIILSSNALVVGVVDGDTAIIPDGASIAYVDANIGGGNFATNVVQTLAGAETNKVPSVNAIVTNSLNVQLTLTGSHTNVPTSQAVIDYIQSDVITTNTAAVASRGGIFKYQLISSTNSALYISMQTNATNFGWIEIVRMGW